MSLNSWDDWVMLNLAAGLVPFFYLLSHENSRKAVDSHNRFDWACFGYLSFIYMLGPFAYATFFLVPPVKIHFLGHVAIIKMNTVSLCIVVALRRYVENIWYCFTVIPFTVQFHAMRQVLWLSSDFGISDAIWVASLQTSLALTKEHNHRYCLLLLCVVLDCYRYLFYPRSATPLNRLSKLSTTRGT